MGEEFPGNSRARKAPPPRPEQEKKVERVTQGEVVRRKKPPHKRFIETFFGDSHGVWGNVVLEILIPAARDMIANAGREAIEGLVYRGDSRPSPRRGSRGGPGYVPYDRYSGYGRPEEPRREMSRRGRAMHDFGEIILGSMAEANEVLDRLYIMIDQFGTATVADLYEMCDLSANFVDRNWGWTDISGSRVRRVRNGYLLDLPRPETLD